MTGNNTVAPNTAGPNRTHHQSGVLPSATGAGCSAAGGTNVFKLVAASAINSLLSIQRIFARQIQSLSPCGAGREPERGVRMKNNAPPLPGPLLHFAEARESSTRFSIPKNNRTSPDWLLLLERSYKSNSFSISWLLSFRFGVRRRAFHIPQSCKAIRGNQAWPGSDCGCAPDTSCAAS